MIINTVPIISAIKPNIHILKIVDLTKDLIFFIFKYFIVKTTTNKSMKKFTGRIINQVIGINHNSQIGKAML